MKKWILLIIIGLITINLACKETKPPIDKTEPATDTLLSEGFQRIRLKITRENFCNPERGFYSHLEWNNATGSVTSASTFNALRDQGYTLVLNIYYMLDYKEKDLDQPMLDLVQSQMNAVRENGFKVVLRFAYSKSQNDLTYDAPLEQAKKHIEQLKPILQKNADIIAVMEAGFIGAWGEWFYTTNYGQDAFIKWSVRRDLLYTILDALPDDRMVCVRTVKHKYNILEINCPTDTLLLAEAYDRSRKARIAYHNDCFVASASDMGTFFSEYERMYCKADSKYVVMGGETCGSSDYSDCDNSLEQLKAYHWSYLNINYHRDVINGWKTNLCFDSIQNSLGYRFELHYLDKPKTITKGKECIIKMRIKNVGFAAPYNPRVGYLLLIDVSNNVVYTHTMEADPRFWFASAYKMVEEKILIPSNLSSGTYKLALWMPDKYESLKNDARYAIRLANVSVWNQSNGYNELMEISIP